jgi:hypothetical protein
VQQWIVFYGVLRRKKHQIVAVTKKKKTWRRNPVLTLNPKPQIETLNKTVLKKEFSLDASNKHRLTNARRRFERFERRTRARDLKREKDHEKNGIGRSDSPRAQTPEISRPERARDVNVWDILRGGVWDFLSRVHQQDAFDDIDGEWERRSTGIAVRRWEIQERRRPPVFFFVVAVFAVDRSRSEAVPCGGADAKVWRSRRRGETDVRE